MLCGQGRVCRPAQAGGGQECRRLIAVDGVARNEDAAGNTASINGKTLAYQVIWLDNYLMTHDQCGRSGHAGTGVHPARSLGYTACGDRPCATSRPGSGAKRLRYLAIKRRPMTWTGMVWRLNCRLRRHLLSVPSEYARNLVRIRAKGRGQA